MNTRRNRSALASWLPAALIAASTLACERGTSRPDAHRHESEGDLAQGAKAEHADEVHLSAEAIEHHRVRVEPVSRHVLVPRFRVPAQVAFNSEGMAHIGIPVQGRVAELRVRLGDEVQRGDALLVVESPELGEAQSDYLLRRSATANAEPAVELARSAHDRAKALYDKNQGIALTEVQKREAEFRVAVAALAAARAAEDAVKNRLALLGMDAPRIEQLVATNQIDARFTVSAPIAGQVIEREVTLGELVGPEREKLLVLADMAKLWVVADVPENRLRQIARGSRARVLLGSEGDHWCEGVVSFVSPALNPATRTVRVRIEPTDRHEELLPGVFAQAEIEARDGGGEPVLALPETATQTVEGSTAVFVPVAGEDGVFAKRAITIGAQVGGFVPVLSGLREGELVVIEGAFILKAELGKSSAEHEH